MNKRYADQSTLPGRQVADAKSSRSGSGLSAISVAGAESSKRWGQILWLGGIMPWWPGLHLPARGRGPRITASPQPREVGSPTPARWLVRTLGLPHIGTHLQACAVFSTLEKAQMYRLFWSFPNGETVAFGVIGKCQQSILLVASGRQRGWNTFSWENFLSKFASRRAACRNLESLLSMKSKPAVRDAANRQSQVNRRCISWR